MKRKATRAFFVGATFVAFVFVLGTFAMAQQPVKLKMTSFLPPPEVSMLAEIAKSLAGGSDQTDQRRHHL